MHGLRLGKRLEKILSRSEFFSHYPEKVNALRNIGFEPSLDYLIDDWDILVMALKTYSQIYGDLRISVKFVVPDEEPWPRICRNLKLGLRIASIRSAGRYI